MKAEWIKIGKYTYVMNTNTGVFIVTESHITNKGEPVCMSNTSTFIKSEHYNKETGEFELIGEEKQEYNNTKLLYWVDTKNDEMENTCYKCAYNGLRKTTYNCYKDDADICFNGYWTDEKPETGGAE